jgi:hypothetical protein
MSELAKVYLYLVHPSSYGMSNLPSHRRTSTNTSNTPFMFRLCNFPSDESVFEVGFEALIYKLDWHGKRDELCYYRGVT